jgi:hypothetical protein
MFENNGENTDDYFTPRHRAQSTSRLLPPDSTISKPVSSRQDQSSTPSSSSPSSSTSSLATGNTSKINFSSFLKISSPNHKSNNSPPAEESFVMTIIRSPSTSSQRTQSNEPVGTTITNEELANNNNFFKNKVTAALNHMKYRKFRYLFIFQTVLFPRLGRKNATKFSYK